MNGVHDFGGMHGWGPVNPEPGEPPFHADWEKRALALTLAMGATGQWNIDMSRSARESLPPLQYLSSSYYQIWLAGLEKLMLERGLVHADEIGDGGMRHAAKAVARRLAATDVAAVCGRRSRAHGEQPPAPAYAPAALRAQPCRRGRSGARLPRVRRPACAR
jgi:nitrile hydratase subunit beta